MWEMTSVWDGSVLNPAHLTTIATLVFTDEAVSGSTGCNFFRSAYTVEGEAIDLGDLALTGSACEPEYVAQGDAVVRALEATTGFTLSDDQLELIDAQGTVLMQFRPADRLPLHGIEWRVVWYGEGTSSIDGSEISLAFNTAGTLTGVAGCNAYTGEYQLEGDRLAFGELAQTLIGCSEPDGVMQQEAAYLGALRRTRSHVTTLTGLELFDADGTPVAEFRFAGRVRNLSS